MKCFSNGEVLLQPLIEEFEPVGIEKSRFENLDANIDKIFGIFGRCRIGSEVKTNAIVVRFCARVKYFPKIEEMATNAIIFQ